MSENQRAPGRGSPPPTPNWVKVAIVIFIVLILFVIVLHLMGFDFSRHGAGRTLLDDFVGYAVITQQIVQQL